MRLSLKYVSAELPRKRRHNGAPAINEHTAYLDKPRNVFRLDYHRTHTMARFRRAPVPPNRPVGYAYGCRCRFGLAGDYGQW